ncbi:hypothetical protein AABD46_19200 [Vibrio parahaemolyticus]|uniref:Uncharacterized protein n=1 Tax=Vibrio parahaemolyticus TaxID=670 RepID=A0AAW8PWP2_VIBPH|nr:MULTISPECIES: hypothetical protein [Vibrio]MBE3697360.1 hypothetical protein [Vibrio parahaemolyticus]MBE3776687.1 hypothetical protein [Vibrio parahaemolyticus]MCZ5866482.1 hypothetical protein [Vibrio parahaemolyticus]MCZ5897445.1 hypothetical protein [Vibrio parahaemolyticus]MCZ6019540.1 hypothetical protein [Vibrio parahaemolyticus]
MASIKDCCITFPIGDCDLTDVEGVKSRIIDVIDSPDFGGCFGDLDVQVRTLQAGPTPRGEGSVSCKADSSGKVSCEGKVSWKF